MGGCYARKSIPQLRVSKDWVSLGIFWGLWVDHSQKTGSMANFFFLDDIEWCSSEK